MVYTHNEWFYTVVIHVSIYLYSSWYRQRWIRETVESFTVHTVISLCRNPHGIPMHYSQFYCHDDNRWETAGHQDSEHGAGEDFDFGSSDCDEDDNMDTSHGIEPEHGCEGESEDQAKSAGGIHLRLLYCLSYTYGIDGLCLSLYTILSVMQLSGSVSRPHSLVVMHPAYNQEAGGSGFSVVVFPLSRPIKVFCCQSLIHCCKQLVGQPGMLDMFSHWKNRSMPAGMADIYDGAVWKSFLRLNGQDFLLDKCTLGLNLNVDWFRPYIYKRVFCWSNLYCSA